MSQALKDLWDYKLTNHTPTPEGIRKIEAMRAAAKAMKDAIIDLCPEGREQALALTSLETMLYHANAAIARTLNEDLIPEEDKGLEKKDGSSNTKSV